MDCRYFDSCSAPLCPKNAGAVKRIWFPNEEICRLHDVPEWARRQRRIVKKANFFAGCFTLAMLERDCRIAKGIKGIDPDGADEKCAGAEKMWLAVHRAITEQDREKMKDRGRRNTALLSRFKGKN